MDNSLIYNALGMTLQLLIPLMGGILVGAFVAGILQGATQIEERLISFAGKLGGLSAALYISASATHGQLLSFAQRLWGGLDFYR